MEFILIELSERLGADYADQLNTLRNHLAQFFDGPLDFFDLDLDL